MKIHPEIQSYLDGEIETIMCRVFLQCENPATTTIPHPIFEQVPACARCAAKIAAIDALSTADKS